MLDGISHFSDYFFPYLLRALYRFCVCKFTNCTCIWQESATIIVNLSSLLWVVLPRFQVAFCHVSRELHTCILSDILYHTSLRKELLGSKNVHKINKISYHAPPYMYMYMYYYIYMYTLKVFPLTPVVFDVPLLLLFGEIV